MNALKLTALLAASFCWGDGARATQYSCLSIITETKAIGKWQALKGWIDAAGLSDEWGKCHYVSDDYPGYAAITNALTAAGVMTAAEIERVLARSVDAAVPDGVLVALYRREMATESGRVKWHGRRVRTVEDVTNLVQTLVYEDGTAWTLPFEKAAALSVAARFALETRRKEESERQRLAQLPPQLRDVETRRAANASTTNEVTVHYTLP